MTLDLIMKKYNHNHNNEVYIFNYLKNEGEGKGERKKKKKGKIINYIRKQKIYTINPLDTQINN